MIPAPRPATVLDEASARQREAADPRASVWVSASAGTGKTKVLTDRVLTLLLAGTAPERILCLTFTRAAAAEMAIRVQQALGAFTSMTEADLAAAIGRLGLGADEAIAARARRLFALVLDCPGGLKIQTIHAFCESLLRRFPVEAGLAPHFQVLDETEQRALLAAARDEVLARAVGVGRAGADDDLARAVDRVAGRVSASDFDRLLADLTNQRGRIARLLDARGGLAGAVAALCQRLDVAPGEDEAQVIAAACRDRAFDGPALRAAATVMEAGSTRDRQKAARIVSWLAASPENRAALYQDYLRGYLTAAGQPYADFITKGTLKKMPDPEVSLDAMAREATRLMAVEERRLTLRTLEGSTAALTIAAALIDAYAARKTAAARLDYDDLILLARGLLSTREAAQWVLYKLDGGIDHVLVDEAQDTSPDQWEVVSRLTGEFFAGIGARAEREGIVRTVFAVGDAKQSIYSFQGADPRGFSRMRADYRARVGAAGGEFRDVPLQHSFRSTAPVLAAVDSVFAGGPAREGVGTAEDSITHLTIRQGQAGRVELWPPLEPEDEEVAYPWDPDPEAATGHAADTRLAALVAERVKSWIGTLDLPARGRKMRAGDVMVLVRTRSRLVDLLVRAFKRLGVGVTGVDRMTLATELAVQDLVALARFLVLPEDDYSLACVLKGPFCGLDDGDLIDLAPKRKGTLWAELGARAGEHARWLAARDYLGALLARVDFARPFELFARVLDENDGRARLIARLGIEAEDPVNEFLELALAFERGHAPSLQGFLAWFGGGQSDIKRDLEQPIRDEVRIMTVHGAKGLQAPVVILPDTMSAQKPVEAPYWLADEDGTDTPLWTPRLGDLDATARALRAEAITARDEEYHRLLYVAMTRAADMLFIAGWRGSKKPPEGCWYNLLRAGLDAAPGVERFTFTDPLTGFEGPGLRLDAAQALGIAPAPGAGAGDWAPDAPAALEGWEAVPPPHEAVPRPLAPSAVVMDGGGAEAGAAAEEPALLSPLAPEATSRFLKGRLVHGLLEILPVLAPGARAAAAARYLARPGLGLDARAREEIARETLALFDDPTFAPLFGRDSLAEVPLTGTVAGAVISGQIDRLVVTPGAVMVVDYKTARPVPEGAGGVPRSYLAQMALYRAALMAMFPGRTVHCALLYTAAGRLIDLPGAHLDRIAAELAGQ